MHVKIIENNNIHKIMYLIMSGISVHYYKKLKIADISFKKTSYSLHYIDKVIKTKNFILFISNERICKALSENGWIGSLCYNDNGNYIRINTYAMLRKLQSKKKGITIYD